MRLRSLFFYLCGLSLLLTGCKTFEKEIPTGKAMAVKNTYTSATYDHSKISNLLVLPLDNPYYNPHVENHRHQMTQAVIRNLGKFNYFNVQFDPKYQYHGSEIINLNTNTVDRTLLGAVGEYYNAQAVLQIRITDFQPYSPMRMKVKSVMIDVQTGERVWAFDHVFDTDDKNVVNSMRIWWNTYRAGGNDHETRFLTSEIRPSFFANFVFQHLANSYGLSRANVIDSIAEEKERIKEKEMKHLQGPK